MDRLNLVIHGNGLDNDGPAHFNVTCSLLKGEALCIFNDKAAEQKEETMDSHIQCLQAIVEHVFRKDNPLHKKNMHYAQKRKKKRKGLMC
jgi:hypothetical protein